jgi:hypothetical protein
MSTSVRYYQAKQWSSSRNWDEKAPIKIGARDLIAAKR